MAHQSHHTAERSPMAHQAHHTVSVAERDILAALKVEKAKQTFNASLLHKDHRRSVENKPVHLHIAHENTYQMEPKRKFQSYLANKAAKEVVGKYLKSDTQYSQELANNRALLITRSLVPYLKSLGYERYRYVVQTHIGEYKGQSMQISSKCLWDSKFDSFAEYTFKNRSLWCVVLIYGVYFE